MNEDSIFKSPKARFDFEEHTVELHEVMAYTGDDYKTAKHKADNAVQFVADEWREKNPQTVDDFNKFYIETKGYIYDLFVWTHDLQMWDLFDKVFTGEEKVLDYGCGICDISIYLAEKGCEVVATDLKGSETLKFGMWRVYNRGLGDKIKFKFSPEDRFDAVIAIDVLEHLPWPMRYVINTTNHLKSQDSFFFCTPRFLDTNNTHPMHLPENFFLTQEIFARTMISLAYRPEEIIEKYFPIWRPMYMKPAAILAEEAKKNQKNPSQVIRNF